MAWRPVRLPRGADPLPCKLLAKERGGALRVVDVVMRSRCSQCKGVPSRALMNDDDAGGERASRSCPRRYGSIPVQIVNSGPAVFCTKIDTLSPEATVYWEPYCEPKPLMTMRPSVQDVYCK
jgi:hypothetical protein